MSKSEFVPIPAFGWSTQLKEGKVVVGLGGLGIGGFGVDYRQNSMHPLLAVDPFPAASPDGGIYPGATSVDGAFGFGFQAGLIYQLTDAASLDFAYTSTQKFDEFKWNSVNDNPEDPAFGTFRELEFGMDVPAVLAGGVSLWT